MLSLWGAKCCCFNLYDQALQGRIIYWPTQTGHLHFWDRILKELLSTAFNEAHNGIFLYAEPWELNWGRHSLFSRYWFHRGSQTTTATEAKKRWGGLRIWQLPGQWPLHRWALPLSVVSAKPGRVCSLPAWAERRSHPLTLSLPSGKHRWANSSALQRANMRCKAQGMGDKCALIMGCMANCWLGSWHAFSNLSILLFLWRSAFLFSQAVLYLLMKISEMST